MSCLRSPQAVRPVNSRIEQVNRVVMSNNQTFTVCIFFFLFVVTLLFLKIYLWENTWSLYPMFSRCGE
jgi:hypothetical protein